MAVDYDARYRKGYAYGKEPNEFVRVIASTLLPPATRPLEVLSLGEGQGRNVVHLAALGHQCTAVDLSAVGLAKTEALASERHVGSRVTTIHADLCHYDPLGGAAEARWDVVLSIFCALPAEPRRRLHRPERPRLVHRHHRDRGRGPKLDARRRDNDLPDVGELQFGR